MVSILHSYESCIKVMPARQFPHLIRVIIGHQEIALESVGTRKQLFMVKLVVGVQPASGPLSIVASGIWRVYEKYRARVISMRRQSLQAITMNEVYLIPYEINVSNTARECAGIPA